MIEEKIRKDVFVGIPSLSRPEYITKKTMRWVKDIELDNKIFVEPQERFLYKQYNGKCVETLEKSGMGLMYSLNSIREYAKKNGYKYLFQLDDDVDGFERVGVSDPVQAFHETVADLYEAMEAFPGIGGVRFTQYRYWLYSKKDMHKWTHINRPLQGICMLRLDAVPHIDDGLKEFTDTVTSLNIWANGYCTLNYGLSGLKVVQNANKGGCQTHDRRQEGLDTIHLLQKTFPKVREKEGSSWFKVDVDISAYLEKFNYLCINSDDKNLQNLLKTGKFAMY